MLDAEITIQKEIDKFEEIPFELTQQLSRSQAFTEHLNSIKSVLGALIVQWNDMKTREEFKYYSVGDIAKMQSICDHAQFDIDTINSFIEV
jgi:hypothetical protein